MERPVIYKRSLIGAFVAFAVWEGLKHLLLMNVAMWVQHTVSAIVEVGLALAIVVMALRALAGQQRELDRMRDMRDKLASALANDLRQPLVEVVGALGALESAPEVPYATQKIVKRAAQSVAPLVGMAVELLRVTPPEEEGKEFQLLSCSHLLRGAVSTTQVFAAAKKVEVRTDIANSEPPMRVLPHSLFAVFMILLENAVRSTPAEGQVSVVGQVAGAEEMEVSISDEGPPMGDDERETLEGQGAQKGTVVWGQERPLRAGLQYCATVVSAHGGSIRTEMSGEWGNTVTISLPLAEPAAV